MNPVFISSEGRVLEFTAKTPTPKVEVVMSSLFVSNTVVPEVEVKKDDEPFHVRAAKEAALQSTPKRQQS